MYLQRIELQGFKSFANKVVLEFPQPGKSCAVGKINNKNDLACGITSIVGPNGSGKSNVVDAVRWVLGEQSLKLLRGKKATDVIFAGSAKKAQMGLAEVSLYLNNEDKSAPIDYSEIVITRRLYRDGNSEYLLNKQDVRLFDIVMLLAKANFGHNTYSIIGQGMIDKIVSYSSQERKEFFDEATGVKQFQIKREKSVNKLKRSRENLAQAKVLIQELDPHLKSLTRQVNKLRQRQEIETELKDWQVKYYGRLWHDLRSAYDQSALAFNTSDKQKLRLENQINELQAKLEEFSQQASRAEEFNNLQQKHDSLIAEKNSILQELAVVKGKLELEYVKIGKQNLSWLENRRDELNQKIKDVDLELKNLKNRLTDNQSKLADKEKALKLLSDELTVWQNNLEIMQDEFYRLKSGGRNNYAFDSVREILSQRQNISGIIGLVSEVGKIKNRHHEAALAAAAGNRLSAVIVESDEVAVQCISYLKERRLGSVTFFPLNKLRDFPALESARELAQEKGAVGLAIDLVDFNSKYRKVFEQVFGSTVVVTSAEAARDLGINRERMVTLDGDVFEKTGVMRGGYRRPESLTWQVLNDQSLSEEKIREISSLKAKISEQWRQKENLIAQLGQWRLENEVVKDKISDLEKERGKFDEEKKRVESNLKESNLSPEEQDAYFKELAAKRQEMDKNLGELEKAIGEVREKIDKFNLEEENKKKEIFSIQQEMHSLQNECNRVVGELNNVKIELAKIETRREDVLAAIGRDLGGEFQFNNITEKLEIDLAEAEAKIEKLKRQLELIGGIDPEVEKEYATVKERYDFLSQQSEDLEKAITDLEKVVVELDKLIKDQFEAEFKRINQDFSRYFKQLFEGGSAKLLLVQKNDEQTEAEKIRDEIAENSAVAQDVENSTEEVVVSQPEKKIIHVEDKSFLANMGIDIEVCPPGKKIKNINVLSGGEKTMTALALICAIIANNPSPFILFDEVDAALDESNSSKFSGIIEELSHKTQFVVITHNRAIMARANVLYGVTMQGDGISRLIGLKLDDVEKMGNQ